MAAAVGLCGSGLATRSVSASAPRAGIKGVPLRSSRLSAPVRNNSRVATCMAFPSNWLRKDSLVPVLATVGWVLPSSIPIYGNTGDSLTGLFFSRIGPLLGQFPAPPAIDDPFWTLGFLWHLGLFACLTLGQIGVQARKEGYFD
eukprot:jgi/Chlat1/8834/Chrsp91S08169